MNTCLNCGEEGSHYGPPGLGSPGQFVCEAKVKSDPLRERAREAVGNCVSFGAEVPCRDPNDELACRTCGNLFAVTDALRATVRECAEIVMEYQSHPGQHIIVTDSAYALRGLIAAALRKRFGLEQE